MTTYRFAAAMPPILRAAQQLDEADLACRVSLPATADCLWLAGGHILPVNLPLSRGDGAREARLSRRSVAPDAGRFISRPLGGHACRSQQAPGSLGHRRRL